VNRQLFSKDYLIKHLSNAPEWDDSAAAVDLLSRVRLVFQDAGELLETGNEPQIQHKVINPILTLINPHFLPGEMLRTGVVPDYVFFADADAVQRKDLKYVIGVADAKEPGKDFERASGERSPTRQVYDYLNDTQVGWGFVTDGIRWRLLNRDSPTDRYFEVNLRRVIETDDRNAWLYFYNLFRREAFLLSEGTSFLDRVKEQSIRFAEEVGDELKERVYNALLELGRGFTSWPENGLSSRDQRIRDRVRENCFILLYRLLFIFYAEARNLLPLTEPGYLSLSLESLRERTAGASRGNSKFSSGSRQLWTALKDLFRLIDRGDARLRVTPYNGGLFSASSSVDPLHRIELDAWDISDEYLSRAIDLLGTVDSKDHPEEIAFIDYSGLEIRHLGSIYESLLEYRLGFAESDHVAVREKGRDRWAPARASPPGSKVIPESLVKAGELFLETEKHERKVSGSYYTPESVVRHIVRSTLSPIVSERLAEANRAGKSKVEAILSLKVCDPAMGSGHFLVETVEFLAEAVLRAAEQDLPNHLSLTEEDPLSWAKRAVVRHCIYGVDLNPLAVELAKVSLWLVTIARDRPLSFLDHRLKCGNSLVGSTLLDMGWLPKERPERIEVPVTQEQSLVNELLNVLGEIEAGLEETVGDVKRKEEAYRRLSGSKDYIRYKFLGDVHTGLFFLSVKPDMIRSQYMEIANEVVYRDPEKWVRKTSVTWAHAAEKEAVAHGAFHWQLEFPDVLVNPERGSGRGFDAIIGNPPYVRVESADKAERKYLMENPHYRCLVGRFDLSLPFLEQGLRLTRTGGRFGMIVSSPVLTTNYGEEIRQWILSDMILDSVTDFGDLEVFPGVGVKTCILEILNSPPPSDQVVRVAAPENLASLGSERPPVPQAVFRSSEGATIRVGLTEEQLALKFRIDTLSIPLGQLCYCITGVVAHDSKTHASKDRLISPVPKNQWYRPYIEAKEWEGRYGWVAPTRFIEYRPDVPGHMHRPKFPELFSSKKIFIQGISGSTLIATLDEQGVIANHSMLCCLKAEDILHLGHRLNLSGEERTRLRPDPRYDLRFILGIICSRLTGFYFSRFLESTAGVPPDIVGLLPIPQIDFDSAAETNTNPAVETLSASEDDPSEQQRQFDFLVPETDRGRVLHDYVSSTVSRLIVV
jgi:type I restriction-modification system DNA methylase subunit